MDESKHPTDTGEGTPVSPLHLGTATLRRRAEERVAGDANDDAPTDATEPRILHELRVHRIELELQNEELQASRDELESSRLHYADLYDFAPVGYFSLKRDGTIIEANLAAAELLGLERRRLPGRWIGDFLSTPDLPSLVVLLNRVFSTDPPPHTAEITLAGEEVIVEMRVTLAAQGDSCRVAVMDVTARKREASLRDRLAEQTLLEHTRYLDSLGRLAGGVAHEFNNKLTAILGNAELVMENANLLDPTYSRLLDIQIAAQSCERLTRQLLGFARKQMITPEVVSLNTVIVTLMPMLHSVLGGRGELAWTPRPDVWNVYVDPAQLEHILVSLVLQAGDDLPGRGTVTIEIDNVICDEKKLDRNVPFECGDYARLVVRDTGTGMDAEQITHLFEPFSGGLDPKRGLGLASVYGIVKQNRGYVQVDSVAGRGTTFSIYFPRATDRSTHLSSGENEKLLKGHETILLAEADEAVLSLCRATLEKLGYTVLTARTGPEALDLTLRHTGPLHLLVTSARTYGLQGRNLTDAITALRPKLRTLYTSEDVSDVTLRSPSSIKLLRKPFSQSQMTHAIRDALDG